LTDGIFWAASPPHQLGQFVAFDVNDFDRELPARTVPADALITSGEFEKIRLAQQALREGRQALDQADANTALAAANRAEAKNPGFYQNAWLRGLALLALERKAEAAAAFRQALAVRPAFLSEKQEIEVLLHQAEKKL
jgi:tetratricopeptide (TPR) repeat protein